jgi:hypothetical protein
LNSGSCIATISGACLKQTAKSLEDPNDWQTIERMIERYMKDKIKFIHVDYIVNYIKKCRECMLSQRDIENDDDDDDDDDAGSRPKKQQGIPSIAGSHIQTQMGELIKEAQDRIAEQGTFLGVRCLQLLEMYIIIVYQPRFLLFR